MDHASVALGLGIGLNTTSLTAYNTVVLKPLPSPISIRYIAWSDGFSAIPRQHSVRLLLPEYTYLRDHKRDFANRVAAGWPVRAFAECPGLGGSVRVRVQLVSASAC